MLWWPQALVSSFTILSFQLFSIRQGRCLMENPTDKRDLPTRRLRWTARLWSIVSIGLILLFITFEGKNPTTFEEWIGFLFFPLGISVGMIAAWRRELIGGCITIGCLMIFYAYRLATTGILPKGLAWLAFAAPGFLFLLTWYRSRRRPPQRERIIGTSFIDPI